MSTSSFTMPPEWHPQSGTWLAWPHNSDTWSQNLDSAQSEFAKLVHAIAADQHTWVLCPARNIDAARQAIADAPATELTPLQQQRIHFVDIATNDAWARDYAPTFVVEQSSNGNKQLHSVDWHYNAWGGKYPPFDDDQKVAAAIADRLNIPNHTAGLCLEGGAIEINGNGVLLITESCVFDPNRNPDVTQEQVEATLTRLLGVQHFVWLPGDAAGPTVLGDDTDGHIDQLARFTDDHTIVHAWTDDASDPQRPGLEENIHVLKQQMRQIDPACRFMPLMLPPAIEACDLRVPACYCNFLITNGSVLVPQFASADADATALRTLKPLFPDRRIVPLDSKNLTVGLGSFHCLTQQQPAP